MEREFKKNLQTAATLFTLLLLASCNQGTIDSPVESCLMPEMQQFNEASETTEGQRHCVLPTENPEANFEINYVLRDFDPEQEAKMIDAIERIKIVVNSIEFKEAVLNHQYNGQKTFVDNNGLTNQEVYEVIMAGAEELNPAIDREMDIDLTLYYKNNSTVGYTYPNTERIWVNDKFFSNNSLGKVAANVVHEWTHKIGFEHDFNNNPSRPYSVPYAIGTIIRELVDGM